MHAQDDVDHLRESADAAQALADNETDEVEYHRLRAQSARLRAQAADAGQALADDECFCVTPTVATNEHGDTWCSVCGERLILRGEGRHPLDQSDV